MAICLHRKDGNRGAIIDVDEVRGDIFKNRMWAFHTEPGVPNRMNGIENKPFAVPLSFT
jgi:hypothetical protein